MTAVNIALSVNQPGPAYIEQLQQFPSASGGSAKWKPIGRWQIRPGDDSLLKPTFVASTNRRIRIRAEAQVLVNVPAGAGQAIGTATLYDRNMTGTNPPVYQINNTTPVLRGAQTTLPVGGAQQNIVVNSWQYLEVTSTGSP